MKCCIFHVVLLLLILQHLSFLWQAFTMSYVNKTTPIHFIDGRCHVKQLKADKSHKTCLANHRRSISHHIMPLVINGLGDRQTRRYIHTHTNMLTKAISKNQVCIGLQPAHTWFNKFVCIAKHVLVMIPVHMTSL